MNANRNLPAHSQDGVHGTAVRRTAVRRTAVREAPCVWAPLAGAVFLTPAPLFVPGSGEAVAFFWLLAILWVFLATLVQALWAGVRHGDWSPFHTPCSHRENRAREDDFDFFTKSGRYAQLRIRADHESLARDADRYFQ